MFFHSIEYPDGTIEPGVVSLEQLKGFYNNLHLPSDLKNKTVLDIGAAEGYYSIELAKAGAIVTAINIDGYHHQSLVDNVKKSNLNIKTIQMSIYDLPKIKEKFDIVLLLGVIYHLRHPLLGIDLAVEVTKEFIIVESHTITHPSPIMYFYDKDQLNNDSSNWWGPSELCIHQMLISAGCISTKLVNSYNYKDVKRVIVHGYK